MSKDSSDKLPMRELAIRLLALCGLGVSTLLLVQYLSPAHSLCTHGGCATVRQSAYAGLAGIPTPALGIAFFAALLAVSVLDQPWAKRARLILGVLGGVAGIGFVAIQAAVIKAWCEYCLVVDGIAIVIAALSLSLARGPAVTTSAMERSVFAGLAILSITAGVAMPALVGHGAPYQTDVRPEIRDARVPGKITIVEFVDFGCPACRAQHDILEKVLADQSDVAVVYKHLPLPAHRGADDAAKAYLCAGDPARAKKLADVLFKAQQLGADIARDAALAVGTEAATFDACVASQAIKDRLSKDHSDAETLDLKGLPTFWIGDERFEGVQQAAIIRDSLRRARDKR